MSGLQISDTVFFRLYEQEYKPLIVFKFKEVACCGSAPPQGEYNFILYEKQIIFCFPCIL